MSQRRLPDELIASRPGLSRDPYGEHPTTGPMIGAPPARYSRAVHDSIVNSIKGFQRPLVAAQIAGIPASTFHNWMRLGKEGNPHLWEFAEDVENAMAIAEGKAIDMVIKAAETDPENFKWWLERSRPEAYAKDVNARVHGELENFVKRLEAALDPATFEKVLSVFVGQPIAMLPHNGSNEEE